VRIAFSAEQETGQGLAINIDGPSIADIERADYGTVIVRHLEDGRGGYIANACIFREDFPICHQPAGNRTASATLRMNAPCIVLETSVLAGDTRADALDMIASTQFATSETMAFFPGSVLASLHALMGDIRQVMSIMAVVTQVLVTSGVLAGLVILTRLFARRLALLRALGAPKRFVFAVVWSYTAVLISAGSAVGVGIGFAAAALLSRIVTARTDILVNATLSWPEFHLVAGFVSFTLLLALVPAFIALSRPVTTDLRS